MGSEREESGAEGLGTAFGPGITWAGFAYNVGLATLGNVAGGALFVGGLYWVGSPRAKEKPAASTTTARCSRRSKRRW